MLGEITPKTGLGHGWAGLEQQVPAVGLPQGTLQPRYAAGEPCPPVRLSHAAARLSCPLRSATGAGITESQNF